MKKAYLLSRTPNLDAFSVVVIGESFEEIAEYLGGTYKKQQYFGETYHAVVLREEDLKPVVLENSRSLGLTPAIEKLHPNHWREYRKGLLYIAFHKQFPSILFIAELPVDFVVAAQTA